MHVPLVYLKPKENTELIVCVYVDDSLVFSNNSEEKLKLKNQLATELKLGETKTKST